MSSAEFQTLSGPGEAETRVRGSRFIAFASPADSEAAARQVLEERSRMYHDATHNCAAWRMRDGLWRTVDAGEPSGSAGAPILAAIDGAELVDVVVVVTRYFGGTKLGVGGLVRAYGDAAAAALSTAPRRRGVRATRASIRYGYEHTSAVMRCLERTGAVEIEHGFAEGQAEVVFTVPDAEVEPLTTMLRETTAGQLTPELLGSTIIHL